jgi:hypothetical protein
LVGRCEPEAQATDEVSLLGHPDADALADNPASTADAVTGLGWRRVGLGLRDVRGTFFATGHFDDSSNLKASLCWFTQGVMESAPQAPRHVMVRQNGERIVHFDDGDGIVCWVDSKNPTSSTDPRETTCGRCLKHPSWLPAWNAAATTVQAP